MVICLINVIDILACIVIIANNVSSFWQYFWYSALHIVHYGAAVLGILINYTSLTHLVNYVRSKTIVEITLEWAGATFVKLTKIWAWQELVFVLAAISKIESREKALNFSYSDGLMTMY